MCRLATLALLLFAAAPAFATPQWLRLPSTPALPPTQESGLAPVGDIRIWYAVFGKGEPVVFLHGGLSNAHYWGTRYGHWRSATK